MNKKILSFGILIGLSLMLLSSCEKDLENKTNKTVIVYMAADNNLSYFAQLDLNEMQNGYIPDYFQQGEEGDVLLVYCDLRDEVPKLYRYYKDEFGVVNKEALMEYEEHDSSSEEVMNKVLTYAANLFPSEDNGLILWSHGTGWLPKGYYAKPYSKRSDGETVPLSDTEEDPYSNYVKSFGSDGGNEMDIKDLAKALPLRYSFIIFDACLMGGIEVAYELKDKCEYFIASAAEVLAGGFPYNIVMEPIFNKEEKGLEIACKMYYDHYNNEGNGATIAMVKTEALTGVAEACLEVFLSRRMLIGSLDMNEVQGYFRLNRRWFYDLDDFISKIATPNQYESFSSAMTKAIVCKWATDPFNIGDRPQFEIKTFSGLSTYIPNPENKVLNDYYKSFVWNKAVRMIE